MSNDSYTPNSASSTTTYVLFGIAAAMMVIMVLISVAEFVSARSTN